MDWVKTDKTNYQNIADAIRTKLDSSDTFLPSEMAAGINAIQTSFTGDMIKKQYQLYTNSESSVKRFYVTTAASGAAVSDENKFYVITEMMIQDGDSSIFASISLLYSRKNGVLTEISKEASNLDGSLSFTNNNPEYGVTATFTTNAPPNSTIRILSMITALN